ncbi:bifunctional phosphopantothenoylcysteine decarboxylase/phosphopantothenate--cysteine ligase CoaBC [Campylobacter sputorum]|uniref:bifunctional phosphopantothenoylcysteine decarboxylase/phosphopantothenate--cysteine ligase CoaBC n=1 Tax=Campylobacter sputorum TaxID=206 RepID=UPI001E3DAC92|nr:bifunctional phosphopantothenoylcysteine decarboxylase/phosphopantothenate--cysteine ligase CoaBC [Campylobacter sputorum]
MLKNKKILLCVCGSVSFYKAYEILSALRKLGADVYVMLSDGALKFANIVSFEALCNHKVLCSHSENWVDGLNHIQYAKMDLVLIAPASANTINRLANGIGGSVFMDTLIAASSVKTIIAPAANNAMLEHFSTKKSLEILKENGVKIVEPVCKILACGDYGKGALADIEDIIYAVKRAIFEDEFFKDKKVVITGGATYENIDDVRAITNFSSGKMSKALSDAFYMLGGNVHFISSVGFKVPYKFTKFKNSFELKTILDKENLQDKDILVMAAAISDYVPKQKFSGKVKKDVFGDKFSLELVKNDDILSNLKVSCKKIGFKMEVDEKTAKQNAKYMLKNKHLDAVCLNVLNDNVKFGSDSTQIEFITPTNSTLLNYDNKENIALKIANLVKSL